MLKVLIWVAKEKRKREVSGVVWGFPPFWFFSQLVSVPLCSEMLALQWVLPDGYQILFSFGYLTRKHYGYYRLWIDFNDFLFSSRKWTGKWPRGWVEVRKRQKWLLMDNNIQCWYQVTVHCYSLCRDVLTSALIAIISSLSCLRRKVTPAVGERGVYVTWLRDGIVFQLSNSIGGLSFIHTFIHYVWAHNNYLSPLPPNTRLHTQYLSSCLSEVIVSPPLFPVIIFLWWSISLVYPLLLPMGL